MSFAPLPLCPHKRREWLRRVCRTGSYALASLIAAMPAAHAHGDDERPTPELMGWGVVCFLLTLSFILVTCWRAPYKARPRFQPRYAPRLKSRTHKRASGSSPRKKRFRAVSWLSGIVMAALRWCAGRSRPLRSARAKTPK